MILDLYQDERCVDTEQKFVALILNDVSDDDSVVDFFRLS